MDHDFFMDGEFVLDCEFEFNLLLLRNPNPVIISVFVLLLASVLVSVWTSVSVLEWLLDLELLEEDNESSLREFDRVLVTIAELLISASAASVSALTLTLVLELIVGSRDSMVIVCIVLYNIV